MSRDSSQTGHQNPARECPLCGEFSRDGHLCHKCLRNAKKAIVRIAQLWVSLEEAITRQDHFAAPSEIRSGTLFGPLPFRPVPSEVAHDGRRTLARWVGVVVSTWGAPRPVATIGAQCRLLDAYAPKLRTSPHAEQWADDMSRLRDAIAGAVDLPAVRSRVNVGPCPERTEDNEPCAGLIVAVYPSDIDDGPHMDCTPPPSGVRVCGKSWPASQWSHLGDRIVARKAQIDGQRARLVDPHHEPAEYSQAPEWIGPRHFITVADASLVYGIPRTTLDRWVKSGKVRPYSVRDLPEMLPAGRVGRPLRHVLWIDEVEAKAADMRLEKIGS